MPLLPSSVSSSDPTAAYQAAGVSLAAGQQAVSAAKAAAKRTVIPHLPMLGGIGGFSAAFELPSGYQQPVLLAGCDGVGTKLLLAHQWQRWDTVGIDLVAMNANDVLASGGQPFAFMDYVATGALEADQFAALLNSVADGCIQAECQLIGGETAEMPGLYAPGHVDVAGFCLGIAEKTALYPKLEAIQPGDVVIGLASSGCHSNGYSLVRKLLSDNQVNGSHTLPGTSHTIAEALLEPTRIYVKPVQSALKAFPQAIRAMAHITGGGFAENLPRVLPETLQAQLTPWPLLPLYQYLANLGRLDWETLTHTFNTGIGFVLVVSAEDANAVMAHLNHADATLNAAVIGQIQPRPNQAPSVVWAS